MSCYKQTADDEALNLTHELEATAETQAQLLVEARKLRVALPQEELAEAQEEIRDAKAADAKVLRQTAQLQRNLQKINAFWDEHRANPPPAPQ